MRKWAALAVAVFFVLAAQVGLFLPLGPAAPRPDLLMILMAYLALRMSPGLAVFVGCVAGALAGTCSLSPVWMTAGSYTAAVLVVTFISEQIDRERLSAQTAAVAAGVLAGNAFAGVAFLCSTGGVAIMPVARQLALASLVTAAVAPVVLVFFRAARFCSGFSRGR